MEKAKLKQRRLRNGNVALYIDYREDGKRKTEATGYYLIPEVTEYDREKNENAIKEANNFMAKRVLDIEDELPVEDDSQSAILFKDFMADYIKRKSANDGLSTSHKSHLKVFEKFVKDYLAAMHKSDIPISMVNRRFAIDFVNYIQSEYENTKSPDNPKPLAQSTQRLFQQYMIAMMNEAVRGGYVRQNAFMVLEKKERIAKPLTQRDFLTIDEVKAIKKVDTKFPMVRDVFLFACFTGLRVSDIKGLTWSHIKSGVDGQYIALTQQKTKHAVTVPLNKTAQSLLPSMEGKSRDDKVFNLPCLSTIDRALKKIAKEANIQKNIIFHMSRHTFATLSLAAGVDIAVVSSILGHSSVKTTQIYSTILMESKLKAISKLNTLLQ